jgi:hypothetical protein
MIVGNDKRLMFDAFVTFSQELKSAWGRVLTLGPSSSCSFRAVE